MSETVVAKASPTLTATGPATGTIGTAVSATNISSTLAGATTAPAATGTVTFTVFGLQATAPTTCTAGRTAVGTGTTVNGNATYHPSAGYTPTGAGDYWWYASYGGDANNNTATSTCGATMSETVVAKFSPTWTIGGPGIGTAGTAIAAANINSVLAGGTTAPAATGTITFKVFGPQTTAPTTCTTGGTAVGTGTTVNGNATYNPTAGYTPTTVGDYWWYALYGGDTNNNTATSTCGATMSETVVGRASPTLTTTGPATGTAGTAITAANISSALAASSGTNATGTVTFKVFGPQTTAPTTKLLRLFRKERYDIIYVHTMPDLLVLVGLIPKLFGARSVLNVHDMMPELYMSKFGISEKHPLTRFLIFQEQFSIRLADKVICVHHPHRDVLCSRGAPLGKITVLPNVPDPLVFRSGGSATRTEASFRIVYHGTIARRLGLDLGVRAFKKAADACPGARLEIYGDGDAADELVAAIKASGVEDRIYFSKKIFRVESIAEMIQGAALGLIPNRRDVATEYMLPVKLLEYVHLGIPVIAPRLLAIQYYFSTDQVAYYEPGDVEELAECIRRLYADPGKRAELARNGAEFAKKFHWDALKEDLYGVVDDGLVATPEAVGQSRWG